MPRSSITSPRGVPSAFLCPITHEPMVDPVICSDGQSYERAAIEAWLRSSDISPLSGSPLRSKLLTPNHALRNAIAELYVRERPSPHKNPQASPHRNPQENPQLSSTTNPQGRLQTSPPSVAHVRRQPESHQEQGQRGTDAPAPTATSTQSVSSRAHQTSNQPSRQSSSQQSNQPSSQPSNQPSRQASSQPSSQPNGQAGQPAVHPARHAISAIATRPTTPSAESARARASTACADFGTTDDAALKVILVGESGVGKTAIVQRLKEGRFAPQGQTTIGCAFCPHLARLAHGRQVLLHIWDTAGTEKYRAFTRQYVRGAAAVVVVFDVARAESFVAVHRWIEEVRAELTSPRSPAQSPCQSPGRPAAPSVQSTHAPLLVLVGSKCDLKQQRRVPEDIAAQLAAHESMPYFEVSAKEGTDVKLLFSETARLLDLRRRSAPPPRLPSTLRLGSPARVDRHARERQGEGAACAGCAVS